MKLTVCLDVSDEAGEFLSKYCATTGLSFDKAVSLIVENLPIRFDNQGDKIRDKSPRHHRSEQDIQKMIKRVTACLLNHAGRGTMPKIREATGISTEILNSTLKTMGRRKLVRRISTGGRGRNHHSVYELVKTT